MKTKFVAVLLLVFALTPVMAFAQSPSVQWNRWDAKINVPASGDQMQIAETQDIQITSGTVSRGTRIWTSPVQIQNVYLLTDNDSSPQQLTQSNSKQPNTYTVSDTSSGTTLQYTLPSPQSSGSSYVVQINYTATMTTSGLVDWKVVPGDRAFPVLSSTTVIHFPNGQAPDTSLVQVSQGNGTATVSGNDLTIKSQGTIPANQAFGIQVPFGAGVGAAGQPSGSDNSGNSGNFSPANPINPNVGTDTGGFQLPGIGTILLVICVVGVLLLFGGGSLLRSLLGMFLGGGGNFSGGGFNNSGSPLGGSNFLGGNQQNSGGGEIQRGFRPSSGGQDRQLPHIGDDKDSGGGASFS